MHVHFHSFPLLFKNLIFFRERVTIRKEQEEDLEKSLLEDRKVDGKSIGGQLSLLKLTLEDKNIKILYAFPDYHIQWGTFTPQTSNPQMPPPVMSNIC